MEEKKLIHRNSSFFEDHRRLSSLKIRCFVENIHEIIKNSILECILSKRGDKFGQYIDRTCILTHDYLHIFEDRNKQKYKGSYQLEYITTEFFKDEVSNNRLGIKFKYQKFTEDL